MDSEVSHLIRQFVSGADTSLEIANAIEVMLDDHFPEDDFIQQTVEMLAMYRPEGGDFLFDTQNLNKRLGETLEYLNGR